MSKSTETCSRCSGSDAGRTSVKGLAVVAGLQRWSAVSAEKKTNQSLGRLWGLSPILAGVLCTLSVPPFGFWPLAIVGLGVLSYSMSRYSMPRYSIAQCPPGLGLRTRMRIAMLFGLALYGPSLWWMSAFSLPGAIFVAALESVITALVFAALPRRHSAALMPAGIVLADSLRSLWPFGGLPLGGLDLGQATGPLARSAAFGGRLLVIGLAACLGAVLAGMAKGFGSRDPGTRRHGRRSATAGVVLSLGTAVMWWAPTGVHDDGRVVRVAVVQGGGSRGNLASDDNSRRTFDAHLAATHSLPRDRRIDVVLWPENTVDVVKLETSQEFALLLKESRELNAPLLAGLVEDVSDRILLNEQAVVNPDGTVSERFEKVRRVPYGEYFPFRSIIEKYNLAPIPRRDFRPGTRAGTLDAANTRFAVAISYEGFFDDRSRGGVRAGGRALMIPTNASSYATTQVPTQQVAAARLRAIETGRWTVQAGPTGLSVVATPTGELRWRSTIEKRQTHIADIALRSGWTPYVRFNDLPILVLTIGAILTGYLAQIRASAQDRRSAR